jgi:hypothetical protein
MKSEPLPLTGKSPRERFNELGTKVLSVSKEEIEKREKEWKKNRRKKPK